MHEVFLSRIAGHARLRNEHNFRVFLEYKDEVSNITSESVAPEDAETDSTPRITVRGNLFLLLFLFCHRVVLLVVMRTARCSKVSYEVSLLYKPPPVTIDSARLLNAFYFLLYFSLFRFHLKPKRSFKCVERTRRSGLVACSKASARQLTKRCCQTTR